MSNFIELFEERIFHSQRLHVQQVREGFEIVLGWETRNKYQILDEHEIPLAYAAEESTGLSGTIFRQIFGHWRSFKVIVFNQKKERMYELDFPFRWFLKTLTVKDAMGNKIGLIEQRLAFFRKKFDLYGENGRKIARINSPFFKFWTFEMYRGPEKIGTILKKWSGTFSEVFADRDNFVVTFADRNLPAKTKVLMLSTCLMVDIVYFERKNTSRMDIFS